ncbi:Glucose-1-phosphate thymidylyltransferase 2 [Kingella potus]|uniref:Glucose-1-phosphate thymidylyltransferase 2 n=1 Tax=Kingella potus TaxID=265175 RepID=A0A377QZN3_9NEIS|nr:nucleotidyltransferase family protein [Kingella potus]STR00467.1 Glucose-1-phosphate thymidylyltransferase 2 [Kingella potus]
MKAMILAAGRGERMRPLTDTTPKPLLQAGREPLIGWHLRRLKAAGIEEIVINHAWLGSLIEERLGNGAAYGVSIAYSPEGGQGLETAGGIATALPLLGGEPFLVVNGDILADIDFSAAVRGSEAMLADGLAHLWLAANPPHHPEGDFSLFSDGLVRPEGQGSMRLTFAGCGLYRPELFSATPPHQAAKLAPLLRQAMAKNQVRGTRHRGLWLDVGTPQRLEEARRIAADW